MKISIGFICIGNSCRSQMAEGFAKDMGKDIFEVYSAGTRPAARVSEDAISVMKEKGIDISKQYPKSLDDIPKELDIVVTMGCGVECPYLLAGYRQEWDLEDPVGMPIEKFREIRDKIEKNVKMIAEKARSYKDKESLFAYLKER